MFVKNVYPPKNEMCVQNIYPTLAATSHLLPPFGFEHVQLTVLLQHHRGIIMI